MQLIKAITLHQPWATLMAIRAKKFETRSWPTSHRGWLAIHAGKSREHERMFGEEYFHEALIGAGYGSFDELPFGCILAIVGLVAIHKTEVLKRAKFMTEKELAFGDYSDGRFAWETEFVRNYLTPIPARGSQGLWTWEMCW